jgi:uncharacterized protein (TIGR02271 family)
MASKETRTNSGDTNPDPITGAPGSHPVGTGAGAAAGGAAGAAVGSVAGPVGTVVGAAVGAVAGGLAGKGVAEQVDPTAEEQYWREAHSSRPYVEKGRDYSHYAPAYQYGWESRTRHTAGGSFDEVEPELRSGWGREHGTKTGLAWEHARPAVRDAWERVGQRQRTAIPVVEEQINVGKREVRGGGVRVETRTSERPVEASVDLREEHVRVERHAVDRPATAADVSQAARGATVEVTSKKEVPVVEKAARVVEEVVVDKRVEERKQTVTGTVKRTDVRVEELDADTTPDAARAGKSTRPAKDER